METCVAEPAGDGAMRRPRSRACLCRYARSLRPCIATARRTSATRHHPVVTSEHLNEEEQKFFPQAGEVLSDEQKMKLAKDYEAEFTTLRIKQEA